jgi:hypothetical protein
MSKGSNGSKGGNGSNGSNGSKGGGNGAGYPSTKNGNPSGGGRDNGPRK